MTDPRDDVAELVAALEAHLAATEELPLEEDANRWLGEAHAVAGDVHESDLDDETLVERLETVVELLEEVETTGHEDADEHVAAARRAAQRVLDRI
jgi:hypothetical protein